MSNIVLPTLQIVPLEQCILHEETDQQRVARLTTQISAEAQLRNPPILGRYPGIDRLIVLDGATRVTALQSLTAPHIVAQIVDYTDPAIELHSWSHLIIGGTLDKLAQLLTQQQIPHSQIACLGPQDPALQRSETLAFLIDQQQRCIIIDDVPDLLAQAELLRKLFATYAHRPGIVRVARETWHTQLQQQRTGVAVVFPAYTKAHLAQLAEVDAVLPAGITRHIIPGRSLRLNIALNIMLDHRPLEEKQAWLDGWLAQRQSSHGIRYYAEPTFLFDE